MTEAALAIGHRAAENAHERRLVERLEDEDLRARQQGGVDFKRRVFRRRANQCDIAGFDARKKRILLRLVESVNLVHEDDRPPASTPASILRGGHDVFDFLDPGQHGAEGKEVRLREIRHHARERGFPGAWRSPEDDRLEQVTLDRFAQRPAGSQELVLTLDFVERSRSHAFGKRHRPRVNRLIGLVEERRHGLSGELTRQPGERATAHAVATLAGEEHRTIGVNRQAFSLGLLQTS